MVGPLRSDAFIVTTFVRAYLECSERPSSERFYRGICFTLTFRAPQGGILVSLRQCGNKKKRSHPRSPFASRSPKHSVLLIIPGCFSRNCTPASRCCRRDSHVVLVHQVENIEVYAAIRRLAFCFPRLMIFRAFRWEVQCRGQTFLFVLKKFRHVFEPFSTASSPCPQKVQILVTCPCKGLALFFARLKCRATLYRSEKKS